MLTGSNGRWDENIDASLGAEQGYLRVMANKSRSNDYQDGTNTRVPSRWDKWNGDLALGWTPDNDTLLEVTMGRGNGEARYAGRSMDGSQFKRESLGMRVEKSNIGEVLDKLEAQVYYNYANHVMDNVTLRSPGSGGMGGHGEPWRYEYGRPRRAHDVLRHDDAARSPHRRRPRDRHLAVAGRET